MDDARGLVSRHGDELQERPVLVRAYYQQSLLSVVVVLDIADGVLPRMDDVAVAEPVPMSRLDDLQPRKCYLYKPS